MAKKQEHKSYMDVDLDRSKKTLAKDIEKAERLKTLREDLTRSGHLDGFSRKRSYREECSFDEPQGPQMGQQNKLKKIKK